MEKHQIVIVISPDGKVTGEVKGVSGAACGPLSAWLDQLGEVTEDRHTDDFYKLDEQGISTGI